MANSLHIYNRRIRIFNTNPTVLLSSWLNKNWFCYFENTINQPYPSISAGFGWRVLFIEHVIRKQLLQSIPSHPPMGVERAEYISITILDLDFFFPCPKSLPNVPNKRGSNQWDSRHQCVLSPWWVFFFKTPSMYMTYAKLGSWPAISFWAPICRYAGASSR